MSRPRESMAPIATPSEHPSSPVDHHDSGRTSQRRQRRQHIHQVLPRTAIRTVRLCAPRALARVWPEAPRRIRQAVERPGSAALAVWMGPGTRSRPRISAQRPSGRKCVVVGPMKRGTWSTLVVNITPESWDQAPGRRGTRVGDPVGAAMCGSRSCHRAEVP